MLLQQKFGCQIFVRRRTIGGLNGYSSPNEILKTKWPSAHGESAGPFIVAVYTSAALASAFASLNETDQFSKGLAKRSSLFFCVRFSRAPWSADIFDERSVLESVLPCQFLRGRAR